MNTMTRVQIFDETVCISRSANTLREGMHPTILSKAIGKYLGRLGFINLVW